MRVLLAPLLAGACAPTPDAPFGAGPGATFVALAPYVDVAAEIGLGDIEFASPDIQGDRNGAGRSPTVLDDIDADGDLDLVVGGFGDYPALYRNDGQGRFAAAELLPVLDPTKGRHEPPHALLFTDLDGDGQGDLLASRGTGNTTLLRGTGGGSFAAAEQLWIDQAADASNYVSLAAGDLDGDGRLDLVFAGLSPQGGGQGSAEPQTTPSRVLYQRAQGWTVASPLGDSVLLTLALTDRDADGDLDILAPPDFELPTAFYRNDGGQEPDFVDDAVAVGAAVRLAAMGIATWDVNRDGTLDYCISDTGEPLCLVSTGDGLWAESAASMGLSYDAPLPSPITNVGWALVPADLDNDGWHELFMAAGAHDLVDEEHPAIWPDTLWQGGPDGFSDVSAETGIDSTHHHFGAAAGDLDGDGRLEIVVTGYDEAPHVLQATEARDTHWLAVDLEGDGQNPFAIGARIEVEAGDQLLLHELSANLGPMQGPRRAHFGLGSADQVERITVTWPDGRTGTWTGIAADQVLVLTVDE